VKVRRHKWVESCGTSPDRERIIGRRYRALRRGAECRSTGGAATRGAIAPVAIGQICRSALPLDRDCVCGLSGVPVKHSVRLPRSFPVHLFRSQPSHVSGVVAGGVNANVHAMRTEMLALPEAERAELVLDLLDSLDDRPFESDRAEVERVSADETARRANQIDSGELVTDSWDDVMDKVAESRRIR